MLPFLGFAVVAYAALVGGLYLFQRQLLYFPDRARPELLGLEKLGVREVILTTEDGLSLLSWYLPARPGRPVIAYFHGNGGHIGYRVERLLRFAREGCGMLMAEYRGYGGNPGAPSEIGFYADGRAALAFLDRRGRPMPLPLCAGLADGHRPLRLALAHSQGQSADLGLAWRK